MRIQCPKCKQWYDVDGSTVDCEAKCECGNSFIVSAHCKRKLSAKRKVIFAILTVAVLFACILSYRIYSNAKYLQYQEDHIRKTMKSALLDLVKYPASSDVVFTYFKFCRNEKFLIADGYVDAPNAFGVKSRNKFSFHIEFSSKNPRDQWVFSKEGLGFFTFGDQFLDAKRLFNSNSLIPKIQE